MEHPRFFLDEGAKDSGLGEMIFHLIRQNVEQKPHKLKSFRALKCNVAIMARDIDLDITLSFQKGELTIYQGIIGRSDIKIIADHDAILKLSLIRIFIGLPNYFDRMGRNILKKVLSGDLKIKGC